MNDKTLYYTALKNLNSYNDGASNFEKICHIIINFMYEEYNFQIPEGGQGTKDGGYDGYDPIKKAKAAYSTQERYEEKINREIEKSKKNGDLEIFYLSNQIIAEPKKKQIERKCYTETGIKLIISGIDQLSQKTEEYLLNKNDSKLYDLLQLSFLRVGECYNRNEVKPFDIKFNNKMYKKQIVIEDKKLFYCTNIAKTKISKNPLLDCIYSYLSNGNYNMFNNISLCGIGYIGKTYLMKTTFNALIDGFYEDGFFILFYDLKYYSDGKITDKVKVGIIPTLIFLDGLDELSENKKIPLKNEINDIKYKNKNVRFIIAGRNSSFFYFEIFDKAIKLYLEKYFDYEDLELRKLMNDYEGKPVADFLAIPIYREFISEEKIPPNSTIDKFYNMLIQDRLEEDKKTRDYANGNTPRMISKIDIGVVIDKASKFCYELFKSKRNVFTEKEIIKYFGLDDNYIFFINSSIIDYSNENSISFVSNFYYEYFTSNALLSKNINEIIQIFFVEEKIYIPHIDILMLFKSLAKTRASNIHCEIMKMIHRDSISSVLICEFDLFSNDDRYKYFKSIFENYNNKNKVIYYAQFYKTYSPLKNIYNMAHRMQQLLSNSHKIKAINLLKSEICVYLKRPSKEKIYAFYNAIILLTPFINDLWNEDEQNSLKKISIPTIQFFLYNKISKKIKGLLSERSIFDWYHEFNWTKGWEQKEWELFYKDISGNPCNLYTEITNDNEYYIKFIFLLYANNDKIRQLLLLPVLRYAAKNKYIEDSGIANIIPDKITDDYETHIIDLDWRDGELSSILKNTELSFSEILEFLIFTIEIGEYNNLKTHHSSPIKIMEEKLYEKIHTIESDNYEKFSIYYLKRDKHDFDYRLHKLEKTSEIENLKKFFLSFILRKKIEKNNSLYWKLSFFLCDLINFSDKKHSFDCLSKIKDEAPQNIYKDIIYDISKSETHILQNNTFVINEYKTLFKEQILSEQKLKEIEEEIKSIKNNDIKLIFNKKKMIEELSNIDKFLSHQTVEDNEIRSFDTLQKSDGIPTS